LELIVNLIKKLVILVPLVICFSAVNADIKTEVTKECKELGFIEGTSEIAKCKLELLVLNKKMSLENKKLEASEAQTRAAEATARATEMSAAAAQSLANSSSWRNNQDMMQRGQRMLSGGCTLGVNC
jgi:hypothetical protein|tara:strand:- start:689 stop:1069 length:381 start_codon:yes stop_codon:yes gene_type:complete